MSRIEELVIEKIRLRAVIGEQKYGVTLERNDLDFEEWLIHLQEELLDGANYVEKLLDDLRQTKELMRLAANLIPTKGEGE